MTGSCFVGRPDTTPHSAGLARYKSCYPLIEGRPDLSSRALLPSAPVQDVHCPVFTVPTFTITDGPNTAFNSFIYPPVFAAVHSRRNWRSCPLADDRSVPAPGRGASGRAAAGPAADLLGR